MSFLGNGFECPVGAVGVIPGDVCTEAGDEEDVLDLGELRTVAPSGLGTGWCWMESAAMERVRGDLLEDRVVIPPKDEPLDERSEDELC